MSYESDLAKWNDARTLLDLGELTASWLEGTLLFNPTYGTPDDPGPEGETSALVPVLERLNRAGIVTDHSQPGEPGVEFKQRAHVSAYCDEEAAFFLELVANNLGLVALLHTPRSRCDSGQIAISIVDSTPYTWERTTNKAEDIDYWYSAYCHPAALAAFKEAWQVAVFDPVWGR
jgi:hypothetical protein